MTTIPTLATLQSTIKSNIQSALGIVLSVIFQTFLATLPTVLAGQFWLLYLYIGQVQNNIWVDTCDAPTLLRFGAIILGRTPYPATNGVYVVSVTGSAGAVIAGNQVWQSSLTSANPNMLFQIVGGPYTLTGSGDSIEITSLQGGTGSLLNIGDTLSAASPILNVNSIVTVGIIATTPVDGETIAAYRIKVIEKIQAIPGSWSAVDYRLVGVAISGVYQTYAYATPGSVAQVDIYLQGTTPGTPIGSTPINNYIAALALVQPLGVWQANVYASTVIPIDVTIAAGTFAPFTTAQQALITSAVTTFINSVQPFIAAADNVATRNDIIATFNLSEVISQAVPGYGFSGVTFAASTVTVSVWQADLGQVPYFNSITFA